MSAAEWVEHRSPEGKPFWFNQRTQESVWAKPAALQSQLEVELASLPWKEYASNGRKYWSHEESKETTWEMPQQVQDVIARFNNAAAAPLPPPSPAVTAAAIFSNLPPSFPNPSSSASTTTTIQPLPGFLPTRPNLPPTTLPQPQPQQQQQQPIQQNIPLPEFQTHAEAEQAFIDMLRTVGVTPQWTWERTMRETIVHPFYKVLKTLAERKRAFEHFVDQQLALQAKERKESLAAHRDAWNDALGRMEKQVGGVKSWWSWNKAKEVLGHSKEMEAVWNGLRNEEERKSLFDDWVVDINLKQSVRLREQRNSNLEKITALLQSLSLDLTSPHLRYAQVHSLLLAAPEYQSDAELQQIAPVDVLAVYEEELGRMERERNEERRKVTEEKRRRARKAREAFVSLLHQLKADRCITPTSTWDTLYPLVVSSPAYDNLLGVPGSSPLDLFWDILDEVQRIAAMEEEAFERILLPGERDAGARAEMEMEIVRDETTWEMFEAEIQKVEELSRFEQSVARAVYDRLHARAVRSEKEERRREEKKVRIQIDDLRYAFKKLDPPVDLNCSYEEILPRIEQTPEFTVMDDDQARRTAFEKFVKRQREKQKEREADERYSLPPPPPSTRAPVPVLTSEREEKMQIAVPPAPSPAPASGSSSSRGLPPPAPPSAPPPTLEARTAGKRVSARVSRSSAAAAAAPVMDRSSLKRSRGGAGKAADAEIKMEVDQVVVAAVPAGSGAGKRSKRARSVASVDSEAEEGEIE